MTTLTPENYRMGFLIDEELMGGITSNPEDSQTFLAFVLRHSTGESLGTQIFTELQPALRAINQIPRPWTFEKTKECGGNCGGEGGSCSIGGCGTGICKKDACKAFIPEASGSNL